MREINVIQKLKCTKILLQSDEHNENRWEENTDFTQI